jgi:hypothetical protein
MAVDVAQVAEVVVVCTFGAAPAHASSLSM